MNDFLSNIARRSIKLVTPGATGMLQPRLPSLFEAPAEGNQIATHHAEEQTRWTVSARESALERNAPTAPKRPESPSVPAEPQRTIVERLEKEVTTKIKPAAIEVRSLFFRQEIGQLPRLDPTLADEAEVKGRPLPNEHNQEAIRESRPIQWTIHPSIASIPEKPGPKSVIAPRTVSATFRSTAPPLERTGGKSSVVQIRIGRIEVRAATAPQTSFPRSVPKPPKLTLDEYLRKRNEGNR
jgi:hypothetical protein